MTTISLDELHIDSSSEFAVEDFDDTDVFTSAAENVGEEEELAPETSSALVVSYLAVSQRFERIFEDIEYDPRASQIARLVGKRLDTLGQRIYSHPGTTTEEVFTLVEAVGLLDDYLTTGDTYNLVLCANLL